MSSKSSRKNVAAPKTSNAIITRKKAAQQTRHLRAKTKKTDKPLERKQTATPETKQTATPETKQTATPETKSTKVTKKENGGKDTLKSKVRQLVELVEQVEYYPDKLKRDLSIKKVLLKPKHNFKVIAATNKRKMGVPQKGGLKSPPPLKKRRGSAKGKPSTSHHSELSMADMVKLIEDNHTLSDEDFMEILTCPSPVWWEDPPDDMYTEDAICKRPLYQSSPISISTDENSRTEEQDDKRTNTPTNKTDRQTDNTLIDFENEIEEFKIKTQDVKNDKFKVKKQKLENVLGNIKNVINIKKININKNEINKNKVANEIKPRTNSTSTDGEDLSDLSFNEEEVLKNLENIQIPVEQNAEQSNCNKIEIDIIGTETIKKKVVKKEVLPIPIKDEAAMPKITVKKFAGTQIQNELAIPHKMPPLTRKPDIKIKKSKNLNSDYLDNVSHSKFKFISDDDVSLQDGNGEEKNEIKDKNTVGESSSAIEIDTSIMKEHEIKKELIDTANTTGNSNKNEVVPKKATNDLSEFITVYKIMSHENEKKGIDSEKPNKTTENNNDRGKLNSFFKKRKNNKRVKKSDSSFPAISLTAVKDVPIESVNSDAKTSDENSENRLKPCDYCVVETDNGTIFACDLCNFHADTKEVYKKHISSCKEVARIPWNRNYLTNQT